MATGKHYGSFAKGFMDSILAVYKLKMTKDLYDARAAYYKQRGDAAETNANARANKNAGLTGAMDASGAAWGQGSGGGGGGAYDGGPKAEAHAQEMSQYLQDKWGLSKAGAAGVVGNAWQESKFASNFNPGGDKGTAAGMFQWRDTGSGSAARQTNARNYMAQNGLDPNDWRSHLDAAMAETQRDYPSMMNQLKTTTDPQYATHEFFHVFERGDPNKANFANRDGMAQAALGGKPATTQTASTTPTKGPNKGKPPKADTTTVAAPAKPTPAPAKSTPAPDTVASRDGSYQVAGDAGPVSAEAAARQKADLEAHRAAPDATPTTEGEAQVAGRGPTGDPASAMEEANRAAAMVGKPDYPDTPRVGIPPKPGIEDPEIAARQTQGQGTLPPRPIVGLQPDDMPSSGVGASAADNYGPPQRTGAPPNVGPTPSSVQGDPNERNMPVPPVGAGGEYRNMPYVGETASGSQRDSKGVYGPKPVTIAVDTGARPDLTARSPASSANMPSKDATPVSATAPSNPTGNSAGGDAPGTVRYQVPNSSASRAPIITVGNLSHLWGPNPPLSQQASAPAPAPSSPLPTRLPDDMAANADLGDQIMGSAKGGPIRRYATGGAIPSNPALGFAAAGSVPSPTYTPAPDPNAIMGDSPGGGLGIGLDMAKGYQNFGNNGMGFWMNNPGVTLDTMTPAQRNWYNEQIGDSNASIGVNTGGASRNWWYNPASYAALSAPTPAAPAAPTPAAPAPPPVTPPTSTNIVSPAASTTITDPTTTTTTGAPSLPNSVTAKSYDPNVDAQTGAGFSNTSNKGGTNYSVGTDDLLKQNADGQISGSRKGGPIKRFAKGGGIPSRPMMKFATGGSAVMAAMNSPGYVGPTLQGGWQGTPLSQLAPNQQAWATTQQGLLSQELNAAHSDAAYWGGGGKNPTGGNDTMQYWNQMTTMPDAIWPTPAPTAPTPLAEPAPAPATIVAPSAATTIVDPTTTTTTGAPGLPNSIQAKSYDPNVDAQTGAGFANTSNTGGTNYSVGTDDLLQQNASGQISGTDQNNTTILSRKGGSIPRVTPRVRYDDGGGVSPSAAGMPPGLGGGQAQPIPPIYYNPATYAGAGAPVGKGITQNSATTFNAGAIPSLPMARGGVVAFDDGGMVGDDTLNAMTTMDLADARDEANAPAPAAAAAPTTQYNASGEPVSDVDPNEFLQPSPTSGAGGSAAPARANTPPPDPTTPEIHDGQGNPSKGLIAAIGDGLHWLGDHLGLTGGGQTQPAIAAHPQQQNQRQQFIQNSPDGATYMSPKDAAELDRINDPNGELSNAYRNIARLEGGYKFAMSQGDTQTAGRLAASILHYSVITSQNLSDQASKALYNGDLQKAVDLTNQASDAVPDGRLVHMALSPDGKTVTVTGSDLDGRALWQKQGAAAEVLERATSMGKDGKLQWNALESQAAKYDSTFAGMQKARTANATAGAKEEAANAESERETEAFQKLYPNAPASAPATTPALPGPGPAPGATVTATTSPSQGAAPSPNSAGAAQPNAAPQTADENQGQGPTVANAAKGAGLPPQPNQADLPAADAQNADLEHPEVEQQNRVNIRQNIVSQFRDLKTGAWTPQVAQSAPPIPVHPSQIPEYAAANPAGKRAIETQYIDGRKQYDAWQKAVTDEMNRQAVAADKNYSDDLVSRRQALTQTHSDTAADTRSQRQIDAAATLEKNRRDDATSKQTYEEQAPLTPQQRQETYRDTTPMAITASLPRYAVTKSDGTIDLNASAQALGKAYDLPPPGGGAATGGLQRATTVSNIASDAATWNTHMATGDVHDLVDGLARGVYTIDGRPTPVTRHGEQMDQFIVHQQQGDPGVTLFLPRQDGYKIAYIKQEFKAAHDAANPPTPAPTSAPTAPAPAIPRTPVRPLIQSRPGEESGVRMPQWVPPEQIPPEQRQLYPELNQ